MIKTRLRIDGVHCDDCAKSIRFALRNMTGVLNAEVHRAPDEAIVTFDQALTNADRLIKTLDSLGFEAREARV